MVANLRCNELKDEALELVNPKISDLNDAALRGKVDNFQEICRDILKDGLSHYEEYAHQYDKTVYEKVKKELIGLILSNLFKVFDVQLKNIRQHVFERFDRELRKLSIRD